MENNKTMKNADIKNYIILGLVIGMFILIATLFIITSNKQVQITTEPQSTGFVANETTCKEILPKLKERLYLEHHKAYIDNRLYSNVSHIETYYSPLLGKCIYSLREQFFAWRNGAADQTNMQGKIFEYETGRELFFIVITTIDGGENFPAYRKFMDELQKYVQK